MLVVALTQRGGQEKGKGHGSEAKQGTRVEGREHRVPSSSWAAWPHPPRPGAWTALWGTPGAQGGGQVKKLWPSKDVRLGVGVPLGDVRIAVIVWRGGKEKQRTSGGGGVGG